MSDRYIMVVFTRRNGYRMARFYADYVEAGYNIRRLLNNGFDVAQMYYFSESALAFKCYSTYVLREDPLSGKVELISCPPLEDPEGFES